MVHTLDTLHPGQRARIRRITGNGALRRRLMDMGLIAGVEIQVVKVAPLGDPVEYRVLGYRLALRKSEASLIEIDDLSG